LKSIPVIIATGDCQNRYQCDSQGCPGPLHETPSSLQEKSGIHRNQVRRQRTTYLLLHTIGVQPICFWDVMPIPRHALTIHPCAEQPNSNNQTPAHGQIRYAAPRGKLRMTLHDYHPPHDKVNATNTVPNNRPVTLMRLAGYNLWRLSIITGNLMTKLKPIHPGGRDTSRGIYGSL
jgi:hypothetical protein